MEKIDISKELTDIKVYMTYDYDRFKKLVGNRNIINLHVKKLISEFRKHYFKTIIITNSSWEIIDGQHRIEAAKNCKLPIYYIIDEEANLYTVQSLNTNSRNWSNEDFLSSFCEVGHPNYIAFRNFRRQFPQFGFTTSGIICTNKSRCAFFAGKTDKDLITETNKRGAYQHNLFSSGEFQTFDYAMAIETAKKIIACKPFYKGYNRANFVRALLSVFDNQLYDHEVFLRKLQLQRTLLVDCSKVEQYIQLIEKIYNWKSTKPVSLQYGS